MNKRSEDLARKTVNVLLDCGNWLHDEKDCAMITHIQDALKQERSKAIRECAGISAHHDCHALCHVPMDFGWQERVFCREQIADEILKLLPEDEKAPTDGGKDATIQGRQGE